MQNNIVLRLEFWNEFAYDFGPAENKKTIQSKLRSRPSSPKGVKTDFHFYTTKSTINRTLCKIEYQI